MSEDILNPVSLIIPILPVGTKLTAPPKGVVYISGAKIIFYNGTAWNEVTSG